MLSSSGDSESGKDAHKRIIVENNSSSVLSDDEEEDEEDENPRPNRRIVNEAGRKSFVGKAKITPL